jgi:CHAT domain-containing protein/tetratricopeptide (TPR) repeat protein
MAKGFGYRKTKKGKQQHNAHLNFLRKVLHATLESNSDPQVVYPLLQANLNLLDDQFVQLLQIWAIATSIETKPEEHKFIAEAVARFSRLIQQFPSEDNAVNLEIAIVGYEVVANIFTWKAFLEEWAITQIHLGTAYYDRNRGKRADNVERAIICYKNALKFFTKEAFPEQWARLQNQLGIAYNNRILGDWLENFQAAINSYNNAQKVYTRAAFPEDWSIIQNNLGVAYSNCSWGKQEECLKLAIHHFKNALDVYTYDRFPEKWAGIKNHLGSTYHSLALICNENTPGEKLANLKSAIDCCTAALQSYKLDRITLDRAMDWAMTQNNLGNAYRDYIRETGAQHLKLDIDCLIAALTVYTPTQLPKQWADIQNNLGLSYRERQQIIEAIRYFQLALEIFTPDTFPLKCIAAGRNLGDTAFSAGLWTEAIQGYTATIDAIEQRRAWAISESRRQGILKDFSGIYEKMVQACINAGQLEKALETVERSRSKRLVDLMASNDLYQGGEISPEVKELLQQYEDLQQRIDQERSQNNSGNKRELMQMGSGTSASEASPKENRAAFQAYNEAIASLEAEKQQIWEQLRRLDPVLAGEIQVSAPNFSAMQKLIDQPTTAILSFYTTSNDTHIFVLRENQITLHTCPGHGFDALQLWLHDNWLLPYLKYTKANEAYRKAKQDYRQAKKQANTEQEQQALKYKESAKKELKEKRDELEKIWHGVIEQIPQELSQQLQLPELINQHLTGIEELILVPHLLLHQIPLAALPIGNGQYLGDKFLIRYTPSCQVLEFCKERGEVAAPLTYGIIEDATEDLPFASFEGEQIAQLYNIPESDRLKGRCQCTKINYRQLASRVQVLHSCHHAQSRLDEPLESILQLAGETITLGELLTPGWRLRNLSDVFLSCCETGLGVPESLTDDILTLSTGFLCAGARNVVSSLWSVDDIATALFSIFYYQHRYQGKSRPEALRQAQIELRQLNKEELLNREDIKELSRQAEAGRKEARNKRSQYELGSADYLKWDCEYRKYASVTNQIHSVKNSQDQEPFSHPRYWAAFTCSGLR